MSYIETQSGPSYVKHTTDNIIEKFDRNILVGCLFIQAYDVSRACLLHRSPVPAMVKKANRSGLLYGSKRQ